MNKPAQAEPETAEDIPADNGEATEIPQEPAVPESDAEFNAESTVTEPVEFEQAAAATENAAA